MEIYRTAYPNELMHHGIEGQKWGKRNGPPYPLDYSDHSAAEKAAEKKYNRNLSYLLKQDRSYDKVLDKYDRQLGYAYKKQGKAFKKLQKDPSNPKLNAKYDKAMNRLLNERERFDRAKEFIEGIKDAEFDKVIETGDYSPKTIRARKFIDFAQQFSLGMAAFLGKDEFDIMTFSREHDLDSGTILKLKEQAKKVARELREERYANLKRNRPGRKVMSSSEIDAAVKKSLESGMFDMEFLERNLDLDQDGNPLKESELKKAYTKFLKEEYGE